MWECIFFYSAMHSYCGLWAKMNFLQILNKRSRVVRFSYAYMRDRLYATLYIDIIYLFPKFVRMYGMCMHHVVCSHHSWHCSSPYKLIISF
jgi:hypothetical protein